MEHMRSAFITGLAILLAGSVRAQYFVNYTAEQGLLSEDVRHVLLDHQGFLWVSSQEGLWRFDGGSFRRFDMVRPLRSGAPRDIAENMALAPDGRIWTVSGATGLGVFDPATEHYTEWQELVGDSLPFPFRLSPGLLVLNNDSILAVAEDDGLLLFLPAQHRWEVMAPNPLEERLYCRVIVRDRFDLQRVWMGASGRLLSCHLRTGQLVTSEFQDSIDNDEVVHIHAIDQDDDGTLWLGTWGDGVMHYDPGKGRAVAYLFDTIPPINGAKNIIQGMARRSAEEFYLGCEDGLRVFNMRTGFSGPIKHNPESAHSLPSGMVTTLMLAPSGDLWICTGNGLSCLSPTMNRFAHVRLGKPFYVGEQWTRLSGVAEVGEDYLLGTDIQGLLRLNKRSRLITHVKNTRDEQGRHMDVPNTFDLFRCGDGPIQLRTQNGAFIMDPDSLILRRVLQKTIEKLGRLDGLSHLCDADGWVWTGAPYGLYKTNAALDEGVAYDRKAPPGFRVNRAYWPQGIAKDRHGNTWFSISETGIGRIPPSGSPVEILTPATQHWLTTPAVWDVEVDEQDRLWLGTFAHGLIITPASDLGGAGTRYLGAKDGLASLISSVKMLRNGDVWCGSPMGLFRIDPKNMSIRHFGLNDGLPNGNFHHAEIREHPSGLVTVYGDGDELIWFDPDSIETAQPMPRIWIDRVVVRGETVARDSNYAIAPLLDLAYDRNFVDVHFSAIALTQRHRVALEYLLDGLARGWTHTGATGVATFTDLPPGEYTFRVRPVGTTNGAQETRLAIHIHPAFWQTWWFMALIALCLIAAFTVFLRWRLNTVRRQERLRSDFERRIGEVEMSALRAQMNPHFLFNSLNSINRYIVKHEPRIASEYLTKFSRLMRSVLNNSKET
nr:histidine kinase [Flavobacteriales bacterium]